MADDSVRLLLSGSFEKEIRYWDGPQMDLFVSLMSVVSQKFNFHIGTISEKESEKYLRLFRKSFSK